MQNLIENRQIRVFISSTFRDMQDERDYLMKRTFPKLKKLAAERDVTLTELDLRWGITEEEAKSGKVVEICLREIENCIPFFIGIIGNRYGWVPKGNDLDGNVTERFQDVNNYLDRHLSVTEMEMQFGVLARKEDMHAYFYLKEQEEEADNLIMLNRLKEEVKASKYSSNTYRSPEDLAQQIEKAFIALLDELFPAGNLTELEKERIGQRSFMNQLAQNYIRDEHNFQTIDEWVNDRNRRQLIITGASGLGKSALVANWVKEKLQDENRDYNIIYHFTGNGGGESDYETIVTALINEIRDVYGFIQGDDDVYENKVDELDCLIQQVDEEGDDPLVLVIDAINQVEDVEDAKELEWLPYPGEKVKFLFTTLETDRTMAVLRERDCEVFTLQPLDLERRTQLVVSYLGLFCKKLTDQQVHRIVTDSQCENTLVLRTVMEELINFGIFEQLDEKIDYYLHAESIESFYQSFLQSFESEFGEEFVKHVLSLISVSCNGLTEDEIIDILNSGAEDGHPMVSRLQWSQFYCAFAAHFNTKGGRINFSHHYISSTVKERYVDEDNKTVCRKEIMDYFEADYSARSIHEFVYQAISLKETERLQKYVCQREVVEYYLNQEDKTEFRKIWSLLLEEDCPIELNWEESEQSGIVLIKLIDFLLPLGEDANNASYDLIMYCKDLAKRNDFVELFLDSLLRLLSYYKIKDDEDQEEIAEILIGQYVKLVNKVYSNDMRSIADHTFKLGKWLESIRCKGLENQYESAKEIYEQLGLTPQILTCQKCLGDYETWIKGVKEYYPLGSEEHKECIMLAERNRKDSLSLFKLIEDMESAFGMQEITTWNYEFFVKRRANQITEEKRKGRQKLMIPSSCTAIADSEYSENAIIREVVIPNSVSSIGDYAFAGCTGLVSIHIPDSVTKIGRNAFEGCVNLVSIRIPNSVSIIEPYTFDACVELKHIEIPASITEIGRNAFRDCCRLNSISLPTGITEISVRTFWGCLGLANIYIPDSVKTIGDEAFSGCRSLTHVEIPDSVCDIGEGAFSECTGITHIDIPDSINWIRSGVFANCKRLKTVCFPNALEVIEGEAFENCCRLQDVNVSDDIYINPTAFEGTGINMDGCEDTDRKEDYYDYSDDEQNNETSIVIPESETIIDSFAYAGYTYLESVTIPNSITLIDEGAFSGCTNLKYIHIPASVIEIARDAFSNCPNLTIDVDENNPVYSSQDGMLIQIEKKSIVWSSKRMENVVIPQSISMVESHAFEDHQALKSVIISDTVTKIGDSTFAGCSGLESMALPDSVHEIGEGCFCRCSSLERICLSNSIKEIGWRMFCQCDSLTEIEIPVSVVEIGSEAFSMCSALAKINIPRSVKTIGSQAFSDCSSLTAIELPDSITKISRAAFYECSSLNSINIPTGVTEIKDSTFAYCSGLASLVIPPNISVIGEGAFFGCKSLSLNIPTTVREIGEGAFDEIQDLTLNYHILDDLEIAVNCVTEPWKTSLYVPKGTEEMYRQHPYFKQFREIIESDN